MFLIGMFLSHCVEKNSEVISRFSGKECAAADVWCVPPGLAMRRGGPHVEQRVFQQRESLSVFSGYVTVLPKKNCGWAILIHGAQGQQKCEVTSSHNRIIFVFYCHEIISIVWENKYHGILGRLFSCFLLSRMNY